MVFIFNFLLLKANEKAAYQIMLDDLISDFFIEYKTKDRAWLARSFFV